MRRGSSPERRSRRHVGQCVLAGLVLLAAPAPAFAAQPHLAVAWNLRFVPATIEVNQGDSIVFFNTDPFGGVGHTLTHQAPDPKFDTGLLHAGESKEVVGVNELPMGTYEFYCTIHPFMLGKLLVKTNTSPAA
jgi:plastocyanin